METDFSCEASSSSANWANSRYRYSFVTQSAEIHNLRAEFRRFSFVNLKIEARETSPPNNVVVVDVHVTLLDENDNSPTFTYNKYEGKVFVNQTEGMLLVQVSEAESE